MSHYKHIYKGLSMSRISEIERHRILMERAKKFEKQLRGYKIRETQLIDTLIEKEAQIAYLRELLKEFLEAWDGYEMSAALDINLRKRINWATDEKKKIPSKS